MTEKHIPFDLETYMREPERLRHADGDKAADSHIFPSGLIGVQWGECGGSHRWYGPGQYVYLRLAAEIETGNVWLVRDAGMDAWQSVIRNLEDPRPTSWRYVEGPYPLKVPQ